MDSFILQLLVLCQRTRLVLTSSSISFSLEKVVINFLLACTIANDGTCLERGPDESGRHAANHLLTRMGMVKRKACTTKSKVTLEDFDDVKTQMLADVKCTVKMEDIPLDLVIYWDQTAIHNVPRSHWTMAKKLDHKKWRWWVSTTRQIYALFGCPITGDVLPLQLIYQGKTKRVMLQSTSPKTGSLPTPLTIGRTKTHWWNTSKRFFFPMSAKRGRS